ncbi:hypothetical protein ACAW49_03060 [Pseudomonas sp. Env-44]|uniref:Uncharacterized protein n=1 Tax=Pseudomonas synxantha TaxID=47883 RepID=A0AAX3I504_9PSED|nr:hypothetical protein [Pseudomonas synxantha]AZE67743.1 hypothetical protein C4K01_3550 [Pseudomonas synxantha]KRP51514.1 hypothetical protein TU77_21260 [Pseudomonas synxantha]SDU19161.1 hypothetical protein SAMN05216475_1598 [Pseudomonas synxantha]VTQ97727.1 Uncharacterised protein [Pseudomonas synxantha]
MTLDSIALWLGYGVMMVGGALLVVAILLAISLVLSAKVDLIGKYLRFYWDLKTLRATMRQLEAEGKVSKTTGVKP